MPNPCAFSHVQLGWDGLYGPTAVFANGINRPVTFAGWAGDQVWLIERWHTKRQVNDFYHYMVDQIYDRFRDVERTVEDKVRVHRVWADTLPEAEMLQAHLVRQLRGI